MHLWRYELLKLPHELDEEDQQMHWWLLVFLINKICTSLVDLTANTNRQATFVMSSRWGILSGAKQNSIAQRDLINRQGSKLKMKSQKHSHGSIWRKYNLRVAGDTDEPQEKQAVMEAKFSRHVLSKMLWRRNKPANSKTVKQEGKRQKKKDSEATEAKQNTASFVKRHLLTAFNVSDVKKKNWDQENWPALDRFSYSEMCGTCRCAVQVCATFEWLQDLTGYRERLKLQQSHTFHILPFINSGERTKVKFTLEHVMNALSGSTGYIYYFFNLGARWGGLLTPRPVRFTPGKRPSTHSTGSKVGPRAGLVDSEKFVLSGIRSPDRSTRSESPYRLRY